MLIMNKIKDSIIKIASMLHNKGMLAACDGNISCRYQDQIIITNSQTFKAWLNHDDFALVNLDGSVVSGYPSSELLMHLKAYNSNPNVKAVIHAHPPSAISLSIVRPDWSEIPTNIISELVIAAGKIPIIPYHCPGSDELVKSIGLEVERHKIMLLSRHGALTTGDNLLEAYMGMERLEHSAQILLQALSVGELSTLSEAEMTKLYAIRDSLKGQTI